MENKVIVSPFHATIPCHITLVSNAVLTSKKHAAAAISPSRRSPMEDALILARTCVHVRQRDPINRCGRCLTLFQPTLADRARHMYARSRKSVLSAFACSLAMSGTQVSTTQWTCRFLVWCISLQGQSKAYRRIALELDDQQSLTESGKPPHVLCIASSQRHNELNCRNLGIENSNRSCSDLGIPLWFLIRSPAYSPDLVTTAKGCMQQKPSVREVCKI